VSLIHRSLDLGLNYLDTAPMYGVGQSERRYGLALRGVPRERYVLSTKVGRVLQQDAAGATTWTFDFSRAGARASFQSSLQRLGVERVDIVFVHDPDDHYQAAVDGAYPVLRELRAEGLIRAIGAGMNQWQMELAFARPGYSDCFLLAGRYTLLDQTAVPEFLPYCVERGIAVVAGGPYNSGILAAGARAGAPVNDPAPTQGAPAAGACPPPRRAVEGGGAAVHPRASGHRLRDSWRAIHPGGRGQRAHGRASDPRRALDRVEGQRIDRRDRADA